MTNEIKRRVFGMCEWGEHAKCIGGYKEMPVVGGVVIPAEQCSCDCGHAAQREREVEK